MRILYVGDIVGSPGRRAFTQGVQRLRARAPLDLVVANAENAAGGSGLTPAVADSLFAAGADALTLGDHTWDQKELAPHLERETRILRPANFSPACPGKGHLTLETPAGRVSLVLVIGRVFMGPHGDCPFRVLEPLLARGEALGRVVLVEIHAEATSEKIAMGRYLDGRVSAVVGTHTHVQTSDERILPGGTAYLTDLGMTGPRDSVLGRAVEPVLQRFLTGMPRRFEVAEKDLVMEGVMLDLDGKTGKARRIERIRECFGD